MRGGLRVRAERPQGMRIQLQSRIRRQDRHPHPAFLQTPFQTDRRLARRIAQALSLS